MAKVITQSGAGTTGQTAIDGANVFSTVASMLTPGAGNLSFYAKTDNKFYSKTSAGVEAIVGGGLTTSLISTSTTAAPGFHYLCNTATAAFNVTLPAGSTGAVIRVSDDNRTWGINNLTVIPATGEAIDGQAVNATLVCDLIGAFVQFMWDGTKWVFDTNGFGGASGTWVIQPIAGATTAQNGYHYLADTTSSAYTLTLPSGVTGQSIKVSDAARTWGTNNLTIAPFAGQKIDGLAINETLVCNTTGGWVILTYNGSTWVLDTTAYAAASVTTYVPQVIGGLLPASGTPGSTNGAAIASGFVGEIKAATMAASTALNASYTSVGSITLTPGVWEIKYSVSLQPTTGSTINFQVYSAARIFNSTDSADMPDTKRSLYIRNVTALSVFTIGSVSASTVVNIPSSKTYQIQVVYVDVAGSNGGNYLNDTNFYSNFYATRIA